jgi:hypothetical protein
VAWKVVATVHALDGRGDHTVSVCWRDDDPWGAVWRAISDALGPYVPEAVYPDESFTLGILRLTIVHTAAEGDTSHIPPRELKPTLCRLPKELPKGVRF